MKGFNTTFVLQRSSLQRDHSSSCLLPWCPHARIKVASQHQVPPNPTRNSESPVFLALWQTDCHVTACHLLFPVHTQFALYFPVLLGLLGFCARSVSWHWVSPGGWAGLSENAHQSLGWRWVQAHPEKLCTFPPPSCKLSLRTNTVTGTASPTAAQGKKKKKKQCPLPTPPPKKNQNRNWLT